MTNVEALKALYVKIGGDPAVVENCTTNKEVLNLISAHFDGAADALSNAAAVMNIANADELSPEKYDGAAEGLSEGSGDVTVYYGKTLLGSLSADGEATLQIEGEVSEADIHIEYVKPEAPAYSIIYDPRAITPETGAPTSATAGSRVSAEYNVGEISSTAGLLISVIFYADGDSFSVPYTANITGSGSNHILELVWYMPAANLDQVIVDRL